MDTTRDLRDDHLPLLEVRPDTPVLTRSRTALQVTPPASTLNLASPRNHGPRRTRPPMSARITSSITDCFLRALFVVALLPPASQAMPVRELPTPAEWAVLSGSRSGGAASYQLMRHRWYSPELGRFISRDPIGFAGGRNLQAYAGSNPTEYRDPSGLFLYVTGANADGLLKKLESMAGTSLTRCGNTGQVAFTVEPTGPMNIALSVLFRAIKMDQDITFETDVGLGSLEFGDKYLGPGRQFINVSDMELLDQEAAKSGSINFMRSGDALVHALAEQVVSRERNLSAAGYDEAHAYALDVEMGYRGLRGAMNLDRKNEVIYGSLFGLPVPVGVKITYLGKGGHVAEASWLLDMPHKLGGYQER